MIDPLQTGIPANAPAGSGGAPEAAPPQDSVRFRRLLESLEQLASEQRTAPPVEQAGDVPAAMARADRGFSLAMELRQRLEDAFRTRVP
ncbi:MAG: hypothetical protein U1E73_01275 [Planctomycetota bacterium]